MPRKRKYPEELLERELLAISGLSDIGACAHRIAESPEGELIDDEASIRRLLDLLSLEGPARRPMPYVVPYTAFHAQDQHLPR